MIKFHQIIIFVSYKKNKTNSEFFVKNMVRNIKFSGVLLTKELQNYFPCYNFNYSIGKQSDIVTSGANGTKNLIFVGNKKYKIKKTFKRLVKI